MEQAMPLLAYHYRNHAAPPGCKQVYIATHGGDAVGAIIYTVPALQSATRNRVLGDRYRSGSTSAHRKLSATIINSEIELISRVVIHPTFRGIGLAVRLVASTLVLRKCRYVEMSAAMGSVNPFAERAGMKAYKTQVNDRTSRVIGALAAIGATEDQIGNPTAMMALLDSLPEKSRAMIVSELTKYDAGWQMIRAGAFGTSRVEPNLQRALKRIASNVLLTPMYYLWANPRWSGTSPQR